MTNDKGNPNAQMAQTGPEFFHATSDFVIPSSLDIHHSSFRSSPIATDAELRGLVHKINAADRVALDTEADSLHSYREKLCLLQISVPAVAGIIDADRGGHEFEI